MSEYRPIGVDTALNLLVQLFGSPYIIPGDEKAEGVVGAYNVTVRSDSEYDRLSQFGTPVLGSFKAEAGTYKTYDKNDKLVDIQIDEFEFPVASIVEFSRRKGTVATETIGGKGSVKEIMGLSDWSINIRGLIVQDDSRLSTTSVIEQQAMLDKLNELAGAIKVEGKLFSERGIHHVLIQEIRYTPVQGKPGLVQYEIDALSDEEFFF